MKSNRFPKRAFIVRGNLSRSQWETIAAYLKLQHGLEVIETTSTAPLDVAPVITVSYQDMLEYALREKEMSPADAQYYTGRIWGKIIRYGDKEQYGLQFDRPLEFTPSGHIDPEHSDGLHLDSLVALLMRLEEELVRVGCPGQLTQGAINRIMLPKLGLKLVAFLQDFVKAKVGQTE